MASSPFRTERRLLSFDEAVTAGFYGQDGWEREQITSQLKVPGDVIGALFPPAKAELCLTLFDGNKPIGHCHVNSWPTFLRQLPINLAKLYASDQNRENKGIAAFLGLIDWVHQTEANSLQSMLDAKGHNLDRVAHRCGLMVLASYAGKGLATRLVAESDQLLKEKGYTAAVVKTTNKWSKQAFEKNGYQLFHRRRLPDHGISIDDEYTVLYKEF